MRYFMLVIVMLAASAGLSAADLSGVVYADANSNGTRDTAETGIPAVTLILLQGTNVITAIQTDANGNFDFTGIAAGTYDVVAVQPSGYSAGSVTVGTAGGTPAVSAVNGVPLASTDTAVGYEFGCQTSCGCQNEDEDENEDENEVEDGEGGGSFGCVARANAGSAIAFAIVMLLGAAAIRRRATA